MPVLRSCPNCGKRNRVPASHLADAGRCGACKTSLPPLSEPLEVDRELFDEIVADARVPVLVDFWASWCGPCRVAAPEVARTATDMAGRAVVLKVDAEQHPKISSRFNVSGIPHFVVLYAGRAVFQQTGVVGHDEMEAWLASATGTRAA